MGRGVEWAVHSCVNMAWTPAGEAVNSARLAEYYKLPAAYLNKQLQALVRAGILGSVSGPRGGFHLARRPENVTVLDIVLALEGPDPVFRCEGILGNVPDADTEQNFVRTLPDLPDHAPGRTRLAAGAGPADHRRDRGLDGTAVPGGQGKGRALPGAAGRARPPRPAQSQDLRASR